MTRVKNPKIVPLKSSVEKTTIPPLNAKRDVVIRAPKFEMAAIKIRGIVPYVQHAFSQKAIDTMIETQEAGQQSRKGKVRQAKDFKQVYENAMYVTKDGWHGIPAAAFRCAAISACRTVGFKMTLAKLSLFIEADGFCKKGGDPLVRITKGKPHEDYRPARNANGSTDIRCRPMWDAGWEATVRVRWDSEQFSASDVVNLFARIGLQVGVGEGRPDSRMSAGCGWGQFEVIG